MQGSYVWTSAQHPTQSPSSLCCLHLWIKNFLTDRKRQMRLGNTRTASTGVPQGSVLFSLYTSDCSSGDLSVKLLKFADDTTVIGLIHDSDEYGQEVEQLVPWCSHNNPELNIRRKISSEQAYSCITVCQQFAKYHSCLLSKHESPD